MTPLSGFVTLKLGKILVSGLLGDRVFSEMLQGSFRFSGAHPRGHTQAGMETP